jgi:hypothetical protein
MNNAISPGAVPARPGLEKEEPEFANEEDIPSDDPGSVADDPELQVWPAPHD